MRAVILIILLVTTSAWAKHTAGNITIKGLRNIFNQVIDSAQKSNGGGNLVFKGKPVFERIPVEFFSQNQIIQSINRFVPLSQNEDFVFMVNWSPINVASSVVEDSLKVFTKGSKENFDLYLKIKLNDLKLFGDYIELCELKDWKCDKTKQLFGRLKNYSIKVKGSQKLELAAVINVKITNGEIKLTSKSIFSNLVAPQNSSEKNKYNEFGISQRAVDLDINFSEFVLPPLTLTIDGEELETDLSLLRSSILEHRDYLARKLAQFAGDFVAKDLTKLLNEKVFASMQAITSQFSVLDYNRELQDVRDQLVDLVELGANSDGQIIFRNELTMMEKIQSVFKSVISDAKYDLQFTGAESNNGKNFQMNFTNAFSLNGKRWNLTNKLRNGAGTLKKPSFRELDEKSYDLAVAISEPLINGAINALNDTKVIQKVVESAAGLKGIYVKKVHLHLEPKKSKRLKFKPLARQNTSGRPYNTVQVSSTQVRNNLVRNIERDLPLSNRPIELRDDIVKEIVINKDAQVVIVAEVEVKISELESESWMDSISNGIGRLLERDKIYFPLEISFTPSLEVKNARTFIALKASNPIDRDSLVNNYGYPYKDMYKVVEKAVLKNLKEDLVPHLKNIPKVEITKYLEASGLKLKPKKIIIQESGHILVTTDIEELNILEIPRAGELQ